MSNEVPPMSMQSRFFRPVASDRPAPPMVPPTGPDSSVWIGRSRAALDDMTPPFDCIT